MKKCFVHGYRTAAVAAAVLALAALPSRHADAQVNKNWITVVLQAEPEGLEPCMSSRAHQGRVIKYNVTETLIQKKPDDGALVPRLALSWQQLNPETWQFKLRPGVTFHDGSPLNAENVKKSLERNWSKPLTCGDKGKFFGDLNIEATTVDDLTLQIKTSRREPILPMRLTGMVIAGPKSPVDKAVIDPVGTGPYAFDSWQPGQQILLKRNEKYWGPKPQIEGIRYLFRAESSVRASMVKIGEADLAVTIAPQDANDPKLDFSFLNSETTFLRIDADKAPMNDKRVRLALNYALDRDSIPGTIMPKGALRASQMIMPSIPGHNHELDKKMIPYDPAKAKQLLAEAKAAGVPVDKEILFVANPTSYPNAGELAEAFVAMYKAAGFNMRILTADPGQYQKFQNKPFKEDRPPILLQSSHDNNFGDPVFSVYYKYGCEGPTSAFCDPAFDKEVVRVTGLGGEERMKGWQEVFRYLAEDAVPSVFLYHMVGFMRVGPRVSFVPDVTSNAEIRVEEIKFK